jgi:predicted transcriptional regulator
MKQNNTQKEEGSKTNYSKKVLEYIYQKGSVSLSELGKIEGIYPQTLRYNLRNLCKNKEIRAYIKMNDEAGFVIPLDEEIYFTTVFRYKNPKIILELINQMCGYDNAISEQAKIEFIELYIHKAETTLNALKKIQVNRAEEGFEEKWKKLHERHICDEKRHAIELTNVLMSRVTEDLSEKVAFALTNKNEYGGYDLDRLYYENIYHIAHKTYG